MIMANPTLFATRIGDVVLTAAVLARIRAGTLTLSLLGEQREVKFDAATANAVLAGTATVKVLHSVQGHHVISAAVLNGLT
jgi:hypothetical protein